MKLDRYCPHCDIVHEVEIRQRQTNAILKRQAVSHTEFYYYCSVTDTEFTTCGLLEENLYQARQAYSEMKESG